jgi:CheY-like chemotaxis protein
MPSGLITGEEFFHHLRSALAHLYDPYFLRKSPLIGVFMLGEGHDSVALLQRILNDGIAALEPAAGESGQSQRRRHYELITYRYIQQFNQEEVAGQLGLSVRHLRREQNAAIYSLASYLWEQYHLGSRPLHVTNLESDEAGFSSETTVDFAQDLNWLKDTQVIEPAGLQEILTSTVNLLKPLAERYGVQIAAELDPNLPGLAVQPVALRQVLLNILNVAVPFHQQATIHMTAAAGLGRVEVRAWLEAGGNQDARPRSLNDDEQANLRIARRIVEIYGGKLAFSTTNKGFNAVFDLPVFQHCTILVVDDNNDFIQLVERSLTGTRYRVVGERVPQLVVAAAEQHAPKIILLDVMMPGMDGWEILGQLREHPHTASTPVVICTILPQEELALSLGAADFLRKPITQDRLLAVLDRQMALREQGSR